MKTLAGWLRAIETKLHRWNNSRTVICRTCGNLAPAGRMRAPVAYWVADNHEWDGRCHVVKVRRFG